jgi:hypothetical protein
MSSKQEIKDLLNIELKTSSVYNEVLLIKKYIIDSIQAPGLVSMNLVYNFTNPLETNDDVSLFKLCFKNEFGFIENNMTKITIIIDIAKFLE